MDTTPHPVARALQLAIGGEFPPVDGAVETVRSWRPGLCAVVAFTGHAFLVADGDPGLPPALARRVDGFGGAHDPRVAGAIAGPAGWVDSLDAVLVARGTGGPPALVARDDLAGHPRTRHAARLRDDVRCVGPADGDALVTIGRGIGGLTELGIEADGSASGRRLVTDALTMVPAGEVVVAAVAPGNARALRCFLAAGFRPAASVQLIVPAGLA